MATNVPLTFEAFWRDHGASAGMKNLGGDAEKTGKHVKGLSVGVVAAGTAIGQFAVDAIKGLAAAGASAVQYGIKVASANEQAEISFTTMLGSATKAKQFLDQLKQFAATTPFEFPELQTAASSLISAGIEANKVIPIMRTLGDVTSGMGTGAEGVQRATIAIQQMNAAGKITGEDLNQLRDAGIPVYDLLAKAINQPKSAVIELAQKGKLGKEALDAMMKALESGAGLERFSGLMDKQSKSLEGMMSTIKDVVGQGLADAVAPAFPFLKAGLDGVTVQIAKLTKWAGENKTAIVSAMITGGRAALGFGRSLLQIASVGLKAFSLLMKSQTSMTAMLLGSFGVIVAGAAKAFGWIPGIGDDLKHADEEFRTFTVNTVVGMQTSAEAADGMAGAIDDQLLPGMDKATTAFDKMADKELTAAQQADKAAGAIGDTGKAAADAAPPVKSLETLTEELATAEDKLATEIDNVIKNFSIFQDGALKSEEASLALAESIADATDSLGKNGKSLSLQSAAGRENRASILGMAKALNDKITADVKAKNSTDGAAKALRNGRKDMIDAAVAAGLNRREVGRMIDKMLLTPKQLKTQINTPGMQTAKDNVKDLTKKVKDADGQTISIGVKVKVTMAGDIIINGVKRGAAGGIGSAVGASYGAFLAGKKPVPGGANRHSGYPWAVWAGDFPVGMGTPIHAWGPGRVTATNFWNYSYGKHTRITHPNGWHTLYAHQSKIAVHPGQQVKAGQVIGLTGSTGNSTGPHLHFEKYGSGGYVGGPSVIVAGDRGPERVLNDRQTRAFESWMAHGANSGGGVTYILNAPNYVGTHEDLRRALVDMNRRGQLEVIRR